MSGLKVGIVGGLGYIGSALADYLRPEFIVKIVDKSPPPTSFERKIEYQKCDILRYSDIKQALADVDLVIHTAIVQIPLINENKKLGYEVNFLGTQNICRVVNENPSIKGMILSGTWHVFGEEGLEGPLDEEFGFRPDKVEDRARLYALSKIAQEVIVRFYDEMSEKIYAVIRMATVLGEEMPERTAASIFISKGLKGESITPYKHSMHRPMLYADIKDVCRTFKTYLLKMVNNTTNTAAMNLPRIVNLCWREPITIIELANTIKETIVKLTKKQVNPRIEVIDKQKPVLFTPEDKKKIRVDQSKLGQIISLRELVSPRESVERIVQSRIGHLRERSSPN